MVRIITPGSHRASFDERFFRHGKDLGDVGQYINTKHYLTYSGSRLNQDRLGLPVDALGIPNIDHNGGTNPFVGPTLTAVNAPVTGLPSPVLYESGVDPGYTSYNPNMRYYTNVAFDKGPTEDMVILIITDVEPGGANRILCGTRTGGAGWQLYVSAGINFLFFSHDGVGFVQTSSPFSSGINVVGITYDTGGLQYVYVNGVLGGSNDISGLGSIASGLGLGIGARVDGGQNIDRDISRLMIWHRAGLADIANAAWHRRVSDYFHGIMNVQSDSNLTFTRNTSGTKRSGTTYFVLGSNSPRAGREEGLLIERTSINKVYNNHNPKNLNGWSWTGGNATIVDDSTALLAAGLREAGPNAIQFANASGAPQIIYGGSQTANTNPHSVSVFGRITAGAGPRIGLRDASSGAFQDLGAMSDSFFRTMVHGATPNDTDQVFAIQAPDGCTIRFEWAQLEHGARCTSPIINKATAAAAQRNFDDFVTDDDPDDHGGSIEFDITPVDWSGNEDAGSILFLTGSGNSAVWVETGTWRARIDGTTDLDSGVAPADGVTHRIRLRWNINGNQSIEVWNGTTMLSRVESAYDGSLYSAGTWEFAAGPSSYIKNVVTYRNGSG
jgi:hypothetical protein